MSMQVEYTLAIDSWEQNEQSRQQVLRDRLRDSLRSRNPRVLQPIEDTIEDVADEHRT